MQQGSSGQMGVAAGDVAPTGSQQQHPLQSIQVGTAFSGWQTAAHMDASPLDAPLVPVLVEPSVVDPPVAGPLWLSLPPEPPVPPSLIGLVLLLHAASPTVEDAPLRTRT
jgi:hypothetical protein